MQIHTQKQYILHLLISKYILIQIKTKNDKNQ